MSITTKKRGCWHACVCYVIFDWMTFSRVQNMHQQHVFLKCCVPTATLTVAPLNQNENVHVPQSQVKSVMEILSKSMKPIQDFMMLSFSSGPWQSHGDLPISQIHSRYSRSASMKSNETEDQNFTLINVNVSTRGMYVYTTNISEL